MKQFRTIFGFEYLSYAKNKVFVGLTALLIAVMAVVLFYPRFAGDKTQTENAPFSGAAKNIAVASAESPEIAEETAAFLREGLGQHQFTAADGDETALKAHVSDGTYDAAILLTDASNYKYIVETAAMTDMTEMTVQEMLTVKYQYVRLAALGLSAEEAAGVMQASVTAETVILGNDQSKFLLHLYFNVPAVYGCAFVRAVCGAERRRGEKLARHGTADYFGKACESDVRQSARCGCGGLYTVSASARQCVCVLRRQQKLLGGQYNRRKYFRYAAFHAFIHRPVLRAGVFAVFVPVRCACVFGEPFGGHQHFGYARNLFDDCILYDYRIFHDERCGQRCDEGGVLYSVHFADGNVYPHCIGACGKL